MIDRIKHISDGMRLRLRIQADIKRGRCPTILHSSSFRPCPFLLFSFSFRIYQELDVLLANPSLFLTTLLSPQSTKCSSPLSLCSLSSLPVSLPSRPPSSFVRTPVTLRVRQKFVSSPGHLFIYYLLSSRLCPRPRTVRRLVWERCRATRRRYDPFISTCDLCIYLPHRPRLRRRLPHRRRQGRG